MGGLCGSMYGPMGTMMGGFVGKKLGGFGGEYMGSNAASRMMNGARDAYGNIRSGNYREVGTKFFSYKKKKKKI